MNKSVLITGASSGIGEACAIHLDYLGFTVFAGVRSEADASHLQAKTSANLQPLILDVTNSGHIKNAQETIHAQVGESGLDGLINNAGFSLIGPTEFLDLDIFRQELEVNLIGAVAVTQAFIPLIRTARGRIVNMSSISGRDAFPFLGAYAASKFALEAITDALRVELSPWGIKVVLIEPGDVSTPAWETSANQARKMLENAPTSAFELYGPVLEMVKDIKKRGMTAEAPARAVADALMSKKPKARYLLGGDAKLVDKVLRRLPVRWRDSFLLRKLPPYGPG